MLAWPSYPTLFEINTWVWLTELSKKVGKAVDLGSVPAGEREGDEMLAPSLYVDLQPWGCHFLGLSGLGTKAQGK
jgi:hypothetical protein